LILADSSIWIDHLRSEDPVLSSLLERESIVTHPFIVGEIALGQLRQRVTILRALRELPQALVADEAEVHMLIETATLFGLGIGYVDAHLLASARLSDVRLWTRDKRLSAQAAKLDLAALPPG
jgi:predicted nucleic acid-binding protein